MACSFIVLVTLAMGGGAVGKGNAIVAPVDAEAAVAAKLSRQNPDKFTLGCLEIFQKLGWRRVLGNQVDVRAQQCEGYAMRPRS